MTKIIHWWRESGAGCIELYFISTNEKRLGGKHVTQAAFARNLE